MLHQHKFGLGDLLAWLFAYLQQLSELAVHMLMGKGLLHLSTMVPESNILLTKILSLSKNIASITSRDGSGIKGSKDYISLWTIPLSEIYYWRKVKFTTHDDLHLIEFSFLCSSEEEKERKEKNSCTHTCRKCENRFPSIFAKRIPLKNLHLFARYPGKHLDMQTYPVWDLGEKNS